MIFFNGNTFYFDKRVVHHILKCSVNTWLISCKDNINFSKNYLYIPTLNDKYNDYADMLAKSALGIGDGSFEKKEDQEWIKVR